MKRVAAAKIAALPPQFGFVAHLITPAVLALAEARLFGGPVLIQNRKPTVEATREQVKLALLIVHHTNPLEDIGDEEEALMRGMSNQTLSNRREQKLITRPL